MMEDQKLLLDHLDKLHTTEMGIGRIKKNLKTDVADVVEYCKSKVLDKSCNIYRQGKTGIVRLIILKLRSLLSRNAGAIIDIVFPHTG